MERPENAPAFIGYWKITQMETWAQDYVDLVVPGFIEFKPEDDHLMGTFQFGTVSGWLDCRLRDIHRMVVAGTERYRSWLRSGLGNARGR